MLRQALWALPFWLLAATTVWADARITVLLDVLKLNEATLILRDEGLSAAEELNQSMLEGQGGAGWQRQVNAIYDPNRMAEMVRAEFEAGLTPDQVASVIAFYDTELGQRIVSLENSARAAIQDPDVEAAARETFQEYKNGDKARLDYIVHYVETGDMITRNVTGALNSNYQFLRGLADGGALEMSEEEMLQDSVESLEQQTQDTTEWLMGFLLLAYHPLSDEELDLYIAFSETEAGLALNAALFTGFGKAYEDISYALGRAVALNMTAQEL